MLMNVGIAPWGALQVQSYNSFARYTIPLKIICFFLS